MLKAAILFKAIPLEMTIGFPSLSRQGVFMKYLWEMLWISEILRGFLNEEETW